MYVCHCVCKIVTYDKSLTSVFLMLCLVLSVKVYHLWYYVVRALNMVHSSNPIKYNHKTIGKNFICTCHAVSVQFFTHKLSVMYGTTAKQ